MMDDEDSPKVLSAVFPFTMMRPGVYHAFLEKN
jgi:hypothetical protein